MYIRYEKVTTPIDFGQSASPASSERPFEYSRGQSFQPIAFIFGMYIRNRGRVAVFLNELSYIPGKEQAGIST